MTCYISFRDVTWEIQPTGYLITVITDVACHLWMRYSLNPPQYHTVPVLRRGLFLHANRYICFTAYKDNEQEEAGDTLVHTFLKLNWPSCQTRYFYFYGSIAGEMCVSTSPVFELHFLAPPIPPITHYYPLWTNRFVRSNSGNWTSCRNGSALTTWGNYQRPLNQLIVDTYLTASYFIIRSWLNFDTQGIGTITAARLGIYPTAKGAIPEHIYVTKGLCLEPIDEDDWAAQTNEITSLGEINLPDIVLNEYNWIPLNAAGIAWINHSALEYKQHESYDWQMNAYWPIYGALRCSESFTPLFDHALSKLRLRLKRAGNAGTLNVWLTDTTPNGCATNTPFRTASIPAVSLSQALWGAWQLFTLDSPYTVIAGHTYAIELWCTGGNASNYVYWICNSTSQYPSGHICHSGNGGATWTSYPTYAAYFIEYEETLLGGTNFCLRTAHDLGNSPPGAGADYNLRFYSAQKGLGFSPILEVTS